jgi:hypothetical protein
MTGSDYSSQYPNRRGFLNAWISGTSLVVPVPLLSGRHGVIPGDEFVRGQAGACSLVVLAIRATHGEAGLIKNIGGRDPTLTQLTAHSPAAPRLLRRGGRAL